MLQRNESYYLKLMLYINDLELHKILTAPQHGLWHGCKNQLLVPIHDLMKYKDSKIQTNIIILDFAKALDTVPHDKLLYKL